MASARRSSGSLPVLRMAAAGISTSSPSRNPSASTTERGRRTARLFPHLATFMARSGIYPSLDILSIASLSRNPHPLDLPLELYAGMLAHPSADLLAEVFDVARTRAAVVDQEVAMQLRDLRRADAQTPAAGGVDHLPRLVVRWILEGRAARAGVNRLRRGARLRDRV